jgi:metal-responsive CopG/Arc/MetJ family transcriptional regulator
MWYHMVVARKQVLVQLDDDLVDRLDALAAARGVSRSELLRRGAYAILEAEEVARADAELRAAYRRRPQDPAIVDAAARLAAETTPEW